MASATDNALRVTRAGTEDASSVLAIAATTSGGAHMTASLMAAVAAGHCWLAWLGAIPAGFMVCDQSFFGHGFIQTLVTHPDYRRRGVGTALIQLCETRCPTEKLFTSTNASNTVMQRLLASLGYRISGYIDNLDEGDPEIVYVKRLRDP